VPATLRGATPGSGKKKKAAVPATERRPFSQDNFRTDFVRQVGEFALKRFRGSLFARTSENEYRLQAGFLTCILPQGTFPSSPLFEAKDFPSPGVWQSGCGQW